MLVYSVVLVLLIPFISAVRFNTQNTSLPQVADGHSSLIPKKLSELTRINCKRVLYRRHHQEECDKLDKLPTQDTKSHPDKLIQEHAREDRSESEAKKVKEKIQSNEEAFFEKEKKMQEKKENEKKGEEDNEKDNKKESKSHPAKIPLNRLSMPGLRVKCRLDAAFRKAHSAECAKILPAGPFGRPNHGGRFPPSDGNKKDIPGVENRSKPVRFINSPPRKVANASSSSDSAKSKEGKRSESSSNGGVKGSSSDGKPKAVKGSSDDVGNRRKPNSPESPGKQQHPPIHEPHKPHGEQVEIKTFDHILAKKCADNKFILASEENRLKCIKLLAGASPKVIQANPNNHPSEDEDSNEEHQSPEHKPPEHNFPNRRPANPVEHQFPDNRQPANQQPHHPPPEHNPPEHRIPPGADDRDHLPPGFNVRDQGDNPIGHGDGDIHGRQQQPPPDEVHQGDVHLPPDDRHDVDTDHGNVEVQLEEEEDSGHPGDHPFAPRGDIGNGDPIGGPQDSGPPPDIRRPGQDSGPLPDGAKELQVHIFTDPCPGGPPHCSPTVAFELHDIEHDRNVESIRIEWIVGKTLGHAVYLKDTRIEFSVFTDVVYDFHIHTVNADQHAIASKEFPRMMIGGDGEYSSLQLICDGHNLDKDHIEGVMKSALNGVTHDIVVRKTGDLSVVVVAPSMQESKFFLERVRVALIGDAPEIHVSTRQTQTHMAEELLEEPEPSQMLLYGLLFIGLACMAFGYYQYRKGTLNRFLKVFSDGKTSKLSALANKVEMEPLVATSTSSPSGSTRVVTSPVNQYELKRKGPAV